MGCLATVMLYIIGSDEYHWGILPFGFSLGVLTGLVELIVFRKYFPDLSLPITIIGKLVFYYTGSLVLILFFSELIQGVVEQSNSFEKIAEEVFASTSLINTAKLLVPIFLVVLYLQVEVLVGKGTFGKYLRGKYHKPKIEHRAFLFLDMVNSTALAEKLGDRRYYRLLNAFFRLMSRPIFLSKGEIYKYVGDEVIVSWKLKEGQKLNDCVDTVFNIYQQIQKNNKRFLKEFHVVPDFRASLHKGDVVCAQVGDLKREIAYNGDVVNSTARMQTTCKKIRERFVISDEVYQRLKSPEDYTTRSIGKVPLAGKTQELHLHVVKLNKNGNGFLKDTNTESTKY